MVLPEVLHLHTQTNSYKMNKITTYEPTSDRDVQQPEFLFNLTATDLLVAIATGQIDPVKIAKLQLANRGQDQKTGAWIGFKAATAQFMAEYKTTNAADYEHK